MIRAVVIEDVPLARERLRRLLQAHPDVALVGEAGTARAGAELLAADRPDLLFLDVTLPDGEGPQVLRALPPERRPLTVFLTARADHAEPAFELEAIDYLLKPVGDEALARALDRARRRLGGQAGEPPAQIAVRSGRRTDFVRLDAVDYVESAGHYLCLHVGREVHLVREPISAFAERFGPAGFVRCHRTALVNIEAVEAVVAARNGDGEVRLRGGAVVPLSRTYREALAARMAGTGG